MKRKKKKKKKETLQKQLEARSNMNNHHQS
jgi:hypothetical protein